MGVVCGLARGLVRGLSRQHGNARLANGQSSACDAASADCVRPIRGGPHRDSAHPSSTVVSSAGFRLLASIVRLLRILRCTTGRAQFPDPQSDVAGCGQRMDRRYTDGNSFRRLPLAKSGAGATDFHWWRSDGLDVWARAKYSAARDWPDCARADGFVGVSDGLAPSLARWARILHLAGNSIAGGHSEICIRRRVGPAGHFGCDASS